MINLIQGGLPMDIQARDVNTYAYGPRSESFSGNIENTESAKIIFDIFK